MDFLSQIGFSEHFSIEQPRSAHSLLGSVTPSRLRTSIRFTLLVSLALAITWKLDSRYLLTKIELNLKSVGRGRDRGDQ